MKHWLYILPLLVACGTAEERAAIDALYDGAAPYQEGRFAEAANIFAEAPHDPRVAYNLGNALQFDSRPDSARAAFELAIEQATGKERAWAYHNLGYSWAGTADIADTAVAHLAERVQGLHADGNDVRAKLRQFAMRDSLTSLIKEQEMIIDSALAESEKAFKAALRLSPEDEDSRYDLALVQRRIAERREKERANKDQEKQEDLSPRAKELLAKAEKLIERYAFKEALELLQAGAQAEPTLLQRKEYIDKVELVTKIAGT